MRCNHEVAGFMTFAGLMLLPSQQDAPSAFDQCRIVTSSDLADRKAPRFAAYHVPVAQITERPKLDLKSNPTARSYRTLLRSEMSKGPNFAGQYRVVIWGCGTSCAMFAIVNLQTGRVITPEGFYATSTVHFYVEDQKLFPDSQSEDEVFGFRRDSRLLVVVGDLDEDESREGAFYLVLEAEHLRLVHSTIVKKDCERLGSKP
jgi:hypothetical protein